MLKFIGRGLLIVILCVIAFSTWWIIASGQTVPINTNRIERLESDAAKAADKADAMEKERALLMVELAELRGSLSTDEKISVGCFLALVSLMLGSIWQNKQTHSVINGQRSVLVDELKIAKTAAQVAAHEVVKLEGELKNCWSRERCPLLERRKQRQDFNGPEKRTVAETGLGSEQGL